jgi:hypothetical protein
VSRKSHYCRGHLETPRVKGHPRALADDEENWLVHSVTDDGVCDMVELGALESDTPINFGSDLCVRAQLTLLHPNELSQHGMSDWHKRLLVST